MGLNPNVRELLKYSYESDRSIVRPFEVADDFAKALYVPTLLDEKLLPAIREDQFDLVLVTGNPGDGKSAFLGRLLLSGCGTTKAGRPLRVLHDATEPRDADDPSASAVRDLKEFLAPLADNSLDGSRPQVVFVVGINKGLLVRTFLSRDSGFSTLGSAVSQALNGIEPEAEVGGVRVRVVDLNRRAEVTVDRSRSASLFDGILERLAAKALWEEAGCADCDSADWCPFLFNIVALREQTTASRMRLLWLVQQLEGDRHATLRDLLAGLAYIIAGHADMYHEGDSAGGAALDPCVFVAREKGVGDFAALFRRLLFVSTFVDDDVYEGSLHRIAEFESPSSALTFGMAPDVLRQHICKLDPANASSTSYWDGVENKVIKSPESILGRLDNRSGPGSKLAAAFADHVRTRLGEYDSALDGAEPESDQYRDAVEGRDWLVYLLVRLARRYHYMFESCPSPEALMPYESLAVFLGALAHCAYGASGCLEVYYEVLDEVIPAAVSRAERLAGANAPQQIRVRWNWPPAEVGAVLLVESHRARLEFGPKPDPFIETSPQYLEYVPGEDAPFRLHLDLRGFEGVYRIARGYSDGFAGVPRTDQFRNFREALRSTSCTEMYLTSEVRPTESVRVVLSERMRFE